MRNLIYDTSGRLVQRTICGGGWAITQRLLSDGSWWNIAITREKG